VTDLERRPAVVCARAVDIDFLIRAGVMNDLEGSERRPCARCNAELLLAPSSLRKVEAGAVALCTPCFLHLAGPNPPPLNVDAEARRELARIDAPPRN
jgi:hypothetical protein